MSSAWRRPRSRRLAATVPTPPPAHGVTLGLADILAAREIWLLVAGAHKAGILASVLDGPASLDVPASLLRRHPGLLVIADDDARP